MKSVLKVKSKNTQVAQEKVEPKYVEDKATEQYLDYINESGNVMRHNGDKYVNTGINLKGPRGAVGPRGLPGKDGITPHIGENGNWYIGKQDTGSKAELNTDEYVTKEELNETIGEAAIEDIQLNVANIDSRLQQVEGLAELSVEGGQIGIASATDFTNRTTEGDLKIPTVGAILNAADEEPTAGSDNLVKSGGVVEFVSKRLYNQQLFSQSDFEMTNYSAGYQSLGGTLKAGVEYKIAIRLTGFGEQIPVVYTLYKTTTSSAYHISMADMVLDSLTRERSAVIDLTPEEDVSYIFMRMENSGIIPLEGNHVYIETYAFGDKFLRVDEQSLTPAQQTKVKENIGIVIKDTFDEESNSLSTDAAISTYVRDVASDAAGALNTETAVLSRDDLNIQETLILSGKPNGVNYFLDAYSYYEPCVEEIYIPDSSKIEFKYHGNSLYCRSKDSAGEYRWKSTTNLKIYKPINGEIFELKVTEAGSDESYSVGDTIGYVIFKDVDTFKANPYGAHTTTLVDGVAANIRYCPKIAFSLGYYDEFPVIKDSTLHIPYQIRNQTIDELNQKIDDIKSSQSLNILFIGNSYTANSVSYVPFILKNVCPNLKFRIGVLFLDGGKLSQHLANILDEDVVNEDGETSSPVNYNNYSYITDEMDSWVRNSYNITIFRGLDDAKWDIVSTHNANRYVVGEWSECYAPFIYRLHKAIADYLKYPIKFGWDLTHGSNTSSVEADVTKFMASVDKAEKAEKLTCTEIIFPYGTAVQNLRTIPAMQQLGDGSHSNLLIDNSHLQSGIGQLAASYAVAIKLLEQVGCTLKIIAESTFPTTEWVQAINTIRGSDIGTGSIGVTEHNCFLAQVAAIQAVKKPYEVTDINEYDISDQ